MSNRVEDRNVKEDLMQGAVRDTKAFTANSFRQNWQRERFTEIIEEIFTQCQSLITKKNSDYTKINESDPFHNFRQEAVDMFLNNTGVYQQVDGITLGLMTRLNDKRRRRENLLLTTGALVLTETIADTIHDEINYLAILLTHLTMHGRLPVLEKVEAPPSYDEMQLKEVREDIHRMYKQINSQKEEIVKLQDLLTEELRNNAPKTNKSRKTAS